MKRFFIGFAFLALLASCNVNMDFVDKDKAKQDSVSIGFGVYVNRGVSTKAGKTGELTTATLREADGGFGVFSYYGNGALYGESSKPDFMYNEKVSFDSQYSKWDYHPIKYWPNEYGAAASSEAADRLTFFAYAPYVEVTPVTGIVTGDATNGIIGLSRNIAAGDPLVMYSSSLAPGNGVDLCWGVAAADFTSSVDGDKNHVDKGKPFIDVIKPKTGDRMTFEFNHALTQLNVQVDADIDVESHAASSLATGTHIYVRSVTFNGFTLRGSLNLNSNTTNGPAWYDISGTGRLKRDPVTVYDGRTDGLEAMAADVNEVPADLNPMIIQNGTSEGVTNTTVNLFNSTEAGAPVLVIPTSGVPVKVTIVYDIETADPSLPGYLSDGTTRGISVENTITKTVQLTGGGNMTLEAGKKYVIGLHLGLTSVKFDATVADWDNASYANTDLPVNTSSIGSVTLSATTATVWRNESVTKPTVTAVTGSDGTDLTSLATIAWSSSDASVATVDETTGDITVAGAGSADIVATATYEGSSQKATFSLNVNEVTAVSITTDPSDAKAAPGGTIALTATLTHTSNGTIATWPTVSWVSGSTDYFTVSPASSTTAHAGSATTATTTATAVAVGSSTITVTVGSDFTSSTVSNTQDLTCENAAPTVYSFRGYVVSKGILKRTENGSEVTYSLTEGTDQLESVAWIGVESTRNQYYHKWTQLKADLGADGNNIKQDSEKLPEGWILPSFYDWKAILGQATNITINNEEVEYGYALVQVTGVQISGNTTNLPGILLLPDETDIQCENLKKSYIGPYFGHDAAFSRDLTTDDIASLTGQGCLFLPFFGEYWDAGQYNPATFSFIPGGGDNQLIVSYLSSTGYLDEYDDTYVGVLYGYVDTAFDNYDPDDYDPDDVLTWLYYTKASGYWLSEGNHYHPARLIKKMN